MPLSLCTITGEVYNGLGAPAAGVSVFIHKIQKSGTVLEYKKKRVARSDALGAISFTVPRLSNIWLSGAFYIGSNSYKSTSGVAVTIPDVASTTLENLGDSVVLPQSVRSVSTTSSALTSDDIIFADVSGAAFTFTLMSAAARTRPLTVKVVTIPGDNVLTLDAAGVETIEGVASHDLYAGDSLTLIPRTATDWGTI